MDAAERQLALAERKGLGDLDLDGGSGGEGAEEEKKSEEEKFLDTLEKGNELITEEIEKLRYDINARLTHAIEQLRPASPNDTNRLLRPLGES